MSELAQPGGEPVKELDLFAFAQLPTKRHPGACCTICHEEFGDEDAILLPCAGFSACQSFHHAECLRGWLRRQLTCPLCRRSFAAELAREAATKEEKASSRSSSRLSLSPSPSVSSSASEAEDHFQDHWRLWVLDAQSLRSDAGGGFAFPSMAAARVVGTAGHAEARRLERLTGTSTQLRSPSTAAATQRPPRPLAASQPSTAAWRRSSRPAAAANAASRGSLTRAPVSSAALQPLPSRGRFSQTDGFFTPLERLDPDTRRAIQRRVAALHQRARTRAA